MDKFKVIDFHTHGAVQKASHDLLIYHPSISSFEKIAQIENRKKCLLDLIYQGLFCLQIYKYLCIFMMCLMRKFLTVKAGNLTFSGISLNYLVHRVSYKISELIIWLYWFLNEFSCPHNLCNFFNANCLISCLTILGNKKVY